MITPPKQLPLIDRSILSVDQRASTGSLPPEEVVERLISEAHGLYAGNDEGDVADYIPALAKADPALFGISVTGPKGQDFHAGDVDVSFPIESISKAFLFSLVSEARGHRFIPEKIGVDNTGLPFDSVMAVELNRGQPDEPPGERGGDHDDLARAGGFAGGALAEDSRRPLAVRG